MKHKVLLLTAALALVPSLAFADYCRDCAGSHNQEHQHAHHQDYGHKTWKKHQRQHLREHRREVRKEYRDHGRTARTSYARVVDVEPVYRYYTQTVHENACLRQDVQRSRHTNWTPTVLGAVIGGAVGHSIGDSHGDADAAAVAGGLLGAAIGRDVAVHNAQTRSYSVRGPCRSIERQQRHREPVEYVVTYRYNGQTYRTHMDRHPGEWVELDVKIKPV